MFEYLAKLWSTFWDGLAALLGMKKSVPQVPATAVVSSHRIVVEIVPNPDIRRYHLNFQISETTIHRFSVPLMNHQEHHLKEVGAVGAKLIRGLALGIDGIVDISIHPYSVSITIGSAFRWQDLEGKILSRLKECWGEHKDEVRVERRTFHASFQDEENVFDYILDDIHHLG